MANHEVPRAARVTEEIHGVTAGGDAASTYAYRHVRRGHERPEFYLVQFRWDGRRIDRESRWTRQYSGPRAAARLEADLREVRELMADSRVAAAVRGAA